jgi:hypothetical protein
MAGLRLDIRDEALKQTKSGVTPIVPGDAGHSAIIERVFANNPAKIMPPKYAHKELSEAQKETLRRWVAEGAVYQGHWAYEPIRRPAVPEVAANPQAPVRNPVDAFIQARLAKEGLPASPQADRRVLIRRVALDLTGLPPTPAEVELFVHDSSPDAYEKLVDRLLGSTRYAEKQAMHWMDAVRYADTSGFHGDQSFPAWPYRDYVLLAFRDNKPFDVFTREQIAGDLLPNAAPEQKIASAYNRMTRTSSEGGLQPNEYLAKYAADRVRTLSNVWLGATMGCAECHDHKFDPITAKDFYSMKAFFADIKETGLVPDRGPLAWGSRLSLPSPEQESRLKELTDQLTKAQQELDEKAESLAERRAAWEKQTLAALDAGQLSWRYQRPLTARSAHGAKLTVYNDVDVDANFYIATSNGASLATERYKGEGLVVASGPNPDNETYTVTIRPGEGKWTALGIEVVQDESLPAVRLSRGADRFVLTEVDCEVSGSGRAATAKPEKLAFILATADGFGQTSENPAMATIDGDPQTGWGASYGEGRNVFLALRFAKAVRTQADSVLTVQLHHNSNYRRATIGRFRLALSAGEQSWPENGDSAAKVKAKTPDVGTLNVAPDRGLPRPVAEALRLAPDQRTEDQNKAILSHFEWAAAELQSLQVKVATLAAQRGMLESQIPQVVVAEATAPRETRILPRGDWMNDSGAVVLPAVPEFLGRAETGAERATRLDLANWIVSPANPLTARVFVNRTWREYFGTGISKTLEDLGAQGEWPVHPELLDWLAAEFMQPEWQPDGTHAWDVKHIIRTIVLSHTYRQSSLANPGLEARDPDNRLLARQSRFRLDAEVVHDVALAVSGLLAEQFGGPSVKPYQPDGYLLAMNFPKRDYSASHGADLYRRALYTHWQRTFLHPSLLAFDATTREECTVNRSSSNTPLQALVLLNDPIFVEAARVFAEKILLQGGSGLDQQLDYAFDRALSRDPQPAERRILASLYQKNLARFQAAPATATQLLAVGDTPISRDVDPAEWAAMTMVARAILNLHETITRN